MMESLPYLRTTHRNQHTRVVGRAQPRENAACAADHGHSRQVRVLSNDRGSATGLQEALDAFLLDLRAGQRRSSTLRFYAQKLVPFLRFLDDVGVATAEGIRPANIRAFLVHLAEGHSPGGVCAFYRGIRAFINFLVRDEIIEINPLAKIRPPRADIPPLDPVPLADVRALLRTCGRDEIALRDKSILLVLVDCGMRAGEAVALNLDDYDAHEHSLLVRQSKSRRPRTVFLGREAAKALRRYLRVRGVTDPREPLWLAYHRDGERTRLSYWGLRDLVKRRAAKAGIDPPTLHSFRRACALQSLRAGMDIVTLRRLLGHTTTQVLERYLLLETQDLANAHQRFSPADALVAGKAGAGAQWPRWTH